MLLEPLAQCRVNARLPTVAAFAESLHHFSRQPDGYSRLMLEDERGTVRTVNVYRGVMTNLIHQHHGRVVDAPRDNLLAEFASVVDVVVCDVEIHFSR